MCLQATVPPGKVFRELHLQRASQKLRAEQCIDSEWDPQWHSTAHSQQQQSLSSTLTTSARVLCTARGTAWLLAAPPQPTPCCAAGRGRCSRNQAMELGLQRKALCTSPHSLSGKMLGCSGAKVHLFKHRLRVLYSDQAVKRLEVTRQVTSSHPEHQITATLRDQLVQASWGLPTYEPIKAEGSHKN